MCMIYACYLSNIAYNTIKEHKIEHKYDFDYFYVHLLALGFISRVHTF
jgi:hypothetical protein